MSRSRFARVALALTASITLAPAAVRADVVLDWNIIALKTTAAAPFNPPLEARNLAIVHAAMFDAVNSITREFHPYAVRLRAPDWASPEAAAVAAAHAALVQLYPEQQSTLDAAYSTSLGLIPDGPAKTNGVAVGTGVALRIFTLRASDGAAAAIAAPYTPGDRPGDWIHAPGLPAGARSWLGMGASVLPPDGSQFRPGPPPALASRRYARDFDEIKAIGSSDSVSRTQDQTDLARFWISTAPQNWNPVARQAAIAQGLTLSENARAFALLNLAGADAFIAAWDAKFAYSQWRPLTAIRAADTDGNAATDADPQWTPLLVTPRFPDYIAGSHHIRRRGAEGARARVRGRPRRHHHAHERHRAGCGRNLHSVQGHRGWRRGCPRMGRNPLANLERSRSDRR